MLASVDCSTKQYIDVITKKPSIPHMLTLILINFDYIQLKMFYILHLEVVLSITVNKRFV